MNQIVNLLEQKTINAFKLLNDINIGNWKPNIISCKISGVDFAVINVGQLLKSNDKKK